MVRKIGSHNITIGAQWLSGRVLDSGHLSLTCVVSLSKNIYSSLVSVQPRKRRPFITERLLMGHNQIKKKQRQNFTMLYLDLCYNVICYKIGPVKHKKPSFNCDYFLIHQFKHQFKHVFWLRNKKNIFQLRSLI